MKKDQKDKILNSLKEDCDNNKINCVIYKTIRDNVKQIKNYVNNFILQSLEERIGYSDISEDEYLKRIYDVYNTNIIDIDKWKQMENDIKLKNKQDITDDDKSTLLMLKKGIRLKKMMNESLIQAYIEMSKGKKFTKQIEKSKNVCNIVRSNDKIKEKRILCL